MRRGPKLILIGGPLAALALTGCGSGGEMPVAIDAFVPATYNTLPGDFDRQAAAEALRLAFPDAAEDAFVTAIQIAESACLVVHYELTTDGRSAVYALRQTDHGEDVMAAALAAGCTNTDNATAFVSAIPSSQ